MKQFHPSSFTSNVRRATCALALGTAFALGSNASADDCTIDQKFQGVPNTNPRELSDTRIAQGHHLGLIVEGVDALENPSGLITAFGYLSDNTKTEPDENTYLVLNHNPGGPTEGYDYGRRFLFQGHENSGNRAYITRINLDVASPDHRITLLTPTDSNGETGFNSIDGSTWNPFSRTLLFTQEAGTNGGVIEMGVDFDATAGAGSNLRTLYGSIGHGGFEGIHPDKRGNVILVEDSGGTTVNFGKNPNSFVYRFVPNDPTDLTQGKLQALQVSINGKPVTFVPVDTDHPNGDMLSERQKKLYHVGSTWPVQWVTVHDTVLDGTDAFDANARAKLAGATPFKRPENGQFQPGTDFSTFFFDVTGDTDQRAGSQPELAARGSWGGIFRVEFDQSGDTGRIGLVVLGDQNHASFDNMAFASHDFLLVAEDRGDTLHDQLNKLDSVWAYDVRNGGGANRLIALGDDRMAVGVEDNEPTGLMVSDGDPTIRGLLGTNTPACGWLMLFTQQHGENNMYEILPGANVSRQ